MTSDSESSLSSSSDEAMTYLRKRKRKSIVYSDSESDSDIEIKPKCKRKPKPVYESDTEIAVSPAEIAVSPTEIAVSSSESSKAMVFEENSSIGTNTSTNPSSHNEENHQVPCCMRLNCKQKKLSNDSSDSDEQLEKCPICLSKFLGQDVASPESCDHNFCLKCLQEWAKKMNTCPVDRLLFNLILVRHQPGGKIIRRISVENKEIFDESDSSSSEIICCEVCGSSIDEDRLLLCDDCDQGYHCDCLNPPLTSVPHGHWYCPNCTSRRSHSHYLPSNLLPEFLAIINNRFRPRGFSVNDGVMANGAFADNSHHRTSEASRQIATEVFPHYFRRVSRATSTHLTTQLHRHRQPTRRLRSSRYHSFEVLSNTSLDPLSRNGEQTESSSRAFQENGNRRQNEVFKVPDVCVRKGFVKCNSTSNSRAWIVGFPTAYTNEYEDSNSLFPFECEEERFGSRCEVGDLAVATYARTGCRNAAQMKRTHISASPLRFMAGRSFPSLGFSSASSPSENCDILGNILETQTVLHSASDYVIQRDGSLSVKQFPVGQQRPLNPVQQSSSTSNASQRNVYYSGSSSSSSPVSGSSSFYDTHISGSTSVDNSGAGYGNNDSHSFVPSRDNCNFTTSDEYRRDTVGNSHSKETKNDHSDDEVDIYSDIESVGENETVVDDDDVDEPVKSYKCEDSQLSNIDNETDSSENELIIDEDVHAEEENDKAKNKCIGGDNCISRNFKQLHCCITPEGSEGGICSDAVDSSDDPHSVADDINVKDKSDSFDGLEENSHDSTSSYVKDLSQDELSCSNAPKNNLVHSHAETENDYTDVGNNSPEKEEENSLDSQRESSSDVDDKHSAKIAKITSVPSYLSQSACDHYEDRELSDSMVSVTSLRGGREKISDYEQPPSKDEGSEYMENVGKKMPSTCSKNLKNDDEMCASQEMRKFIVQGKDKYGLARTDINDEKNTFFYVEKELLNVKESNNSQVESFAKSSEFSNSVNNIQSSNVCYQGNSEGNAISKHWDQNKDGDLVHHSALVGGEPCAPGHSSNISILNMEGKDFHSDLSHVDHVGNDSAKNFHVSQNDYMDHSVIKEVGIEMGEKNLKSAAAFVKLDKNMKSSTRGSESGDNMSDSHDTDLGIEDISEAGSDELNRNELIGDEKTEATFINLRESHIFNIEQNCSSLKQNNSHSFEIGSISCKNNEVTEDESPKKFIDKGGRYISELKHSIHHTEDDKEEGEIVDEVPVQTKINKHDQKLEYAHDDVEDYIDMTPRINIADLPRIPKIKRDKLKNNLPEEPPSEVKRTSVLGRVDLGTTDISWKRLSKHTRERSYRDGRPKDERLLYREREGRIKEKKGSEIGDRRNEEKHREQERRRDDAKKTDLDRNKDKCQNDRLRDRKNEKVKEVHEKCNKNKDWNYGTPKKRDRDKLHEKPHKEKDKHERDKDRHERERHERDKDRYGRDEERYDRDSEVCRFDEDSRYEKIKHEKEKPRDKDRKHRHKDRKAESGTKERSQNKHKRSHSREHFSEKQKEREVRKVDDKLKIVVEHKELKKDKLDKHIDKKESKHDKKHREEGHRHHEHRKKDRAPSPYMQLAPIESKEIFAKGDSIIINVNFSRSSSRESVPSLEDSISHYAREGKKSLCNDLPKADLLFIPDDIRGNKSKHSLIEKERNVLLETLGTKRPSTPPERMDRNSQVLSVGESYWQESDDIEIKSPPEDKSAGDKICTDDDNAVESSGAFDGDNFSDSEVEDLSENITTIKNEDNESVPINSAKITIENFSKDEEDFSIPRRRSPHSPPPQSPPSPPDNDSYDPCEPTRSPSSVESSPVPLPTLLCSSERPRPPPSPELPPLPPEPEPTESLIREDPRSHKHTIPCPPPEFSVLSSAANDITSQASPHTQSSVPAISLPNIRVPPPNFIPHSVNRTASSVPLQLVQSRTINWSVADPPPMLYPSNQVQHVVRGSFMQSQIQTSGLPLPPSTQVASQMGSVTQPTNSHSNTSQVRHPQISAHSALPSSSLPPNVPLSHFNISQLQIPNMNHPPPNVTPTASTQHSNIVVSIQNQSSSSLPLSVQGQTSRTVSVHNQLLNISSSIQSLPSTLPSTPPTTVSSQTVSISSSISNQSHLPPPPPITLVSSQKLDKLTKHSPIDKTEVVDMDVDSPYSPGDSPSMDSAYDYSPPSSPLHRATDSGKDVFDNLLGTNKSLLNDKHNIEFSSKGMSHKVPCKSRLIEHQSSRNSFEKPSKRQKVDDRSESSKARHSVRLQLTDKGKTSSIIRKEQKISDKKEVLIKLDESQLKILDELPSSAVEMQVKEKHNLSLQFLKKLNRQERVVEEVKLSLKPYYTRREINKDEYKDVLRKSVPKICHNRSGEINPVKVKSLVEGYIKKIKYARKKAEKKSKSSRLS